MIDKLSDQDKKYIIDLVSNDKREEARALIAKILGVKRTQQYHWLNKLYEESKKTGLTFKETVTKVTDSLKEIDVEEDQDLEFKDKYVFNKDTGQYIFFCKKAGKNIVLEESLFKSILQSYSNFNGPDSTINEMSRKFNIPRNILSEILNIYGFTHDEIPVTKEELFEKTPEEITEDLLQTKKFEIYQKFQKKDWKETQEDANKWRALQIGQLNPFKDFVNTFKPQITNVTLPNNEVAGDHHIVFELSDLHFGAHADEEELYLGKGWNIEETTKSILTLCAKAKAHVLAQKAKYASVKLLLMGDLLDSLTGETEKGTELDTHPIGEKQFEVGFKVLETFISGLLEVCPKIEVIGVAGNHSYYGDWALMKCLEKFFSSNPNVKFNISKKRWVNFEIEGSLFIAEHGYSAFYKAKVPKGDLARESYIKTLLLSKPELLINSKRRYFLTADQHSLEYKEYNGFEFIRFSTPVRGNKFVDHLALTNAPRQNALIVNKDGVQQIVNFYL